MFKSKLMCYVYILKCSDGNHYTGCTSDLKVRFSRHQNGLVQSTKSRRPVELLIYIAFADKYKAYFFEKYLKSGSGKAFANKRFL
jgi:predicted GIY-YIG superfamily endonuclease